MDFPVVDIEHLDDPQYQADIANHIARASATWGFLLLKNHSIPQGDVDDLFGLARRFFLDESEAVKSPWPVNTDSIGYSRALSDRYKDDKASMWFAGKAGVLAHNLHALPPFWHTYTAQIDDFKQKCHQLIMKLLVCFAIAMDLPDRDFFAKAHSEDVGNGNVLRMICYPARTQAPLDTTTRMSSHSDSGSVTLLFQTCAGLEVESPSGEWVPAPCLPGHILVNLGDALAFWSGRRLKATRHRVSFATVPHDRERLSMAYFAKAEPETVLQPLRIRADDEPMGEYKANGLTIQPGITVGEYSRLIMESIYGAPVEPAAQESSSRTAAPAA